MDKLLMFAGIAVALISGGVWFFTGFTHDPKLAARCVAVGCLGLVVAAAAAFL